MNLKEFSVVFAVMCEYFDAKPSEGLTQIYYEDLKALSMEDLKNAFKILRNTRIYKGLPKIAEIKDVILGRIEDQAPIAYQILIETMKRVGPWETVIFEDGAIGKTVEAMGGWEHLNEMPFEEWKYRKKEFEQLYMVNIKSGRNEPIKLSGCFDHINATTGHEGFNKPILITKDMKFIEGGEVKQINGKESPLLSIEKSIIRRN